MDDGGGGRLLGSPVLAGTLVQRGAPQAAFSVLDSVIWNAALIGLGWYLGSQWTLVREYASIIEYAILAALIFGIVWFVCRR